MVKKYRSIKSAYRDGFRIEKIKNYGDYVIATARKNDDTLTLQERSTSLVKFFGQAKFRLMLIELED